MPKKRQNVKAKTASKDEAVRSEASTEPISKTKTIPKLAQENIEEKNNVASLIRIGFMIALLLGLAGVLFFPKLISLAESTMGMKPVSSGHEHVREASEHDREEAQGETVKQTQTNVKDVTLNEGDLMENEETEMKKQTSLGDKQNQDRSNLDRNKMHAEKNTDFKEKDYSKKSKSKDAEIKATGDQSHFDTANMIPPRKGRNGSGKPIILNSETSHVVIDPSQIKIIDSPPDTNTDGSNKKSGKNITGKTSVNKSKADISKSNLNKDNTTSPTTIEEEIQKFKPTFHKTFTPKKIFDGGRRIPPIELLHQKPSNSSVKVFLFDDFLSAQECDGLIRAHDNHVKAANKTPILCFDSVDTLRSHLKDAKKNIKISPNVFTAGTRCVNESFSLQLGNWLKSNWSYSTAFYPGESKFSKILAERIQKAMGLDPVSGGKFQITSYPVGKAYKEHTDCIVGGVDQRDRVVTVLIYLNDVDEGGETRFTELGIWVKPKKGRALVWNNMSPEGVCEPHSKHVASVVKKGSKYILIRWYYYKTFYSLGHRPAPPNLPQRESDQAMVMCDVYNSGSCRWYDEWTYEHLLDYKKNKLKLI
ncbi:uncharacterized protein LOC106073181 isoform X1 [Biomphalaria glabrata]|uniref:Uncharacterized protein LOC106073181 isoform X1 n=1 Tax=Biomphalaria glabrata TaxID=6526 RepID=A0A9W2ZJP0_BIOGL|nr:uncharacterized protein LOC106073181 isoform X1 [Biomphalaria glabrata]XP_055875123.1 uncharacterized protein LOC106073181 isoform X1 [Biomphalaria glabrata]